MVAVDCAPFFGPARRRSSGVNVIRRNLVPPRLMPYRTATGALLDSGDFPATLKAAVCEGDLAGLLVRRDVARAQGRCYGIGFAAVVEPSVSNMGYITTALTIFAMSIFGTGLS
jgi:2-furoyl-CoA dehydrogenase large subunit